jgi:hypothetical protein
VPAAISLSSSWPNFLRCSRTGAECIVAFRKKILFVDAGWPNSPSRAPTTGENGGGDLGPARCMQAVEVYGSPDLGSNQGPAGLTEAGTVPRRGGSTNILKPLFPPPLGPDVRSEPIPNLPRADLESARLNRRSVRGGVGTVPNKTDRRAVSADQQGARPVKG